MCYGAQVAGGARKSEPFSIRLDEATMAFVEHEARRTRRSKSAVVEALTEEASRQRRFPGIGFRGDDAGRRAWVIGTGLDVWELVELRREHSSDEALLDAHPTVDSRALRLASAYQAAYTDEVEADVAANRVSADTLRASYPFIELAAGG